VTIFRGADIIEDSEYQTFEDIGMHEVLLKNLNKCGFTAMTPIQRKVIPIIACDHDIMGCSQTGSGKTVSFLSPVIDKLLKTGPPSDKHLEVAVSAPVCLILVPTRELAEQIYKEARKLCFRSGLSVAKVYGGVGYDGQKIA
jgi:ATP-dependent RNA helicase DDX3X